MMENKEVETNKKSYNRIPTEDKDPAVKKFDETNHVTMQNENIEQDLLVETEKKSFNRLPDERDAHQIENNEQKSGRKAAELHTEAKDTAETEKKSYNRNPDGPVKEPSVQQDDVNKKKTGDN